MLNDGDFCIANTAISKFILDKMNLRNSRHLGKALYFDYSITNWYIDKRAQKLTMETLIAILQVHYPAPPSRMSPSAKTFLRNAFLFCINEERSKYNSNKLQTEINWDALT